MKVSFVVTVYNKENYIGATLDSLKKVKGDFRKEFIIVNDGSTDNSLALIKKHSLGLPNTTIISRGNKGPSASTNEGLLLATGKYIKFLDGDDILDPDAVLCLMDALERSKTSVAFGLRGSFDASNNLYLQNAHHAKEKIIEDPLKALLGSRYRSIRLIGSSASMVRRDLIEEIGGSDPEIFVQDYSLALRCASRTNFIFCPKTVCYAPTEYNSHHISFDKKFETLNTLLALRNFIDFAPEQCKKLSSDIYKSVVSRIWKLDRRNFSFFPKYLLSKIYSPALDVLQLKDFINKNIEKYLQK